MSECRAADVGSSPLSRPLHRRSSRWRCLANSVDVADRVLAAERSALRRQQRPPKTSQARCAAVYGLAESQSLTAAVLLPSHRVYNLAASPCPLVAESTRPSTNRMPGASAGGWRTASATASAASTTSSVRRDRESTSLNYSQ